MNEFASEQQIRAKLKSDLGLVSDKLNEAYQNSSHYPPGQRIEATLAGLIIWADQSEEQGIVRDIAKSIKTGDDGLTRIDADRLGQTLLNAGVVLNVQALFNDLGDVLLEVGQPGNRDFTVEIGHSAELDPVYYTKDAPPQIAGFRFLGVTVANPAHAGFALELLQNQNLPADHPFSELSADIILDSVVANEQWHNVFDKLTDGIPASAYSFEEVLTRFADLPGSYSPEELKRFANEVGSDGTSSKVSEVALQVPLNNKISGLRSGATNPDYAYSSMLVWKNMQEVTGLSEAALVDRIENEIIPEILKKPEGEKFLILRAAQALLTSISKEQLDELNRRMIDEKDRVLAHLVDVHKRQNSIGSLEFP